MRIIFSKKNDDVQKKKTVVRQSSLASRALSVVLSVILAAVVCAFGVLLIIYNGPSSLYRQEFDEYLTQELHLNWLSDLMGGGSDE